MRANAPNWRQRTVGGLVLLLAVAAVGRMAYELLAPVVPLLLVLLVLLGIYAFIVGQFRR